MTLPRVGFLGTGWIGRDRMRAMVETGAIEPVAIVDPSPECAAEAAELAPGAAILPSYEAMVDHAIDGLVIATPSALHAPQAIAALDRGIAVFCQKPLGRNEAEATAVIEAARKADRLLGVDLSYRHTAAAQAIAGLIGDGALGDIFGIDLTFHNAYGPDKDWFYDREQSGGGCLIDLGVHLADLALWFTGCTQATDVGASLFAQGQALASPAMGVEDYAVAQFVLETGTSVRLACSWRLPVGQDAAIEIRLYGTGGGATMRNIGGSFYDFEALHHRGTHTDILVTPPDDWGGRAAAQWAEHLSNDHRFDPAGPDFAALSRVIDQIYGAAAKHSDAVG